MSSATRRNGAGVEGATYAYVTPQDEYKAFDQLPYRIRETLRYAHFKYSSGEALKAYRSGIPEIAIISIIKNADAQYSRTP